MRVYNSLTFQKEEFETINPNEVLMYVCGPTVYDSPHLGHAKSAVNFDVIRRYLEFKGFDVKVVKNYTDIDDKILNRAEELDMDWKKLGDKYTEEYEEVMDSLNIKRDFKNPQATDIIDFMIEFIQGLVEKGYAYESNGSVYFHVKSFKGYNTIFQNVSEDEEEETEIEDIPEDQEPLFGDKYDTKDFVLWKKRKKGEPYWESPWGPGRPGWHIECSAMAIKFLGETIDVHGGGLDLRQPHHQNEIAQAEAYTGQRFANYFLHNGFVNVEGEKMSKSLGNFTVVSEVLKKYKNMVVRLFLLSAHYRKSLNYTDNGIEQAKKNYERLMKSIHLINEKKVTYEGNKKTKELIKRLGKARENIMERMDDDFDSPGTLAEIYTLFRDINRMVFEENSPITEEFKERFFSLMKEIDKILGIFPNLDEIKQGIKGTVDQKDRLIKDLIDIIQETRSTLRKKKMYELSDKIREELKTLGIIVEDS
ncbi:MAG: Cysteine--tRNA ligase [Promethearchaeota archaeon]|nr:MAG: Cysteine--tRNA ligase [Candidatus Lokiarchaeota archaeon]